MNLTQLFTGGTSVEDKGYAVSSNASARVADVNRQIRSLIPGQTIQGEVLGRNGGEVQLKISGDVILNARVDQSITLEPGQNIIFEVRSNGSALSLSPLFTNVSADINVLKAIDMSGLPMNQTTVSMTEQMMKAGLPVNRNALHQMFREVNSFPKAEVTDVVNLHKLGMSVNEESLQQMISYRNLTHTLTEGINQVLETLPLAIDEMLSGGNLQGLSELYHVFEGGLPAEPEEAGILPGAVVAVSTGNAPTAIKMPIGVAAQENGDTSKEFVISESERTTTDIGKASGISGAEQGKTIQSTAGVINAELQEGMQPVLQQGVFEEELELIHMSPEESKDAEALQRMFSELRQVLNSLETPVLDSESTAKKLQEFDDGKLLRHLMGEKGLGKLFADFLKQQWTIKPEQVAEPEQVEKLYRNLTRQLKALTGALEAGGQENGASYKAASVLSGNIDFMNQLNQMYTYVQLPLQLQHGEARGELYVYTNKRSLAEREGKVSALLHLDMENLGQLDVYVSLKDTKVSTNFYVEDEEILCFLERHMNALTERLAKRGYDCKCTMTTRNNEKGNEKGYGQPQSGIAPLLQEGEILLSQHAFDVRT